MIQVYTGNGKGKTTAAIGQVVRAAGNGMKSFFAMFMKDYSYSELSSLKKLSDFIELRQYAHDRFVFKKELPAEELKKIVKDGLNECKDKMLSGDYDIIVLDEAIVSIYFKLIELDDLIALINKCPENVELILTGRYCPQEIIDIADLVTDMREVKHYYNKGLLARQGIEN